MNVTDNEEFHILNIVVLPELYTPYYTKNHISVIFHVAHVQQILSQVLLADFNGDEFNDRGVAGGIWVH